MEKHKKCIPIICLCIFIAVLAMINRNFYRGVPLSTDIVDEAWGYKVFATAVKGGYSNLWFWKSNKQPAIKWEGADTLGIFNDVHLINTEPLIFVAEVYQTVNIVSYLVNVETDSVVHLACDYGLWGVTMEDQIVMSSRGFYDGGGTYTVLNVFDMQGNEVREIQLNAQPDTIPSYYE